MWHKVEAGDYCSDDGRFEAYKTYDRLYGNHWILRDKMEPDYYRSLYHEFSLKECKEVAETLAKQEKEDM